MTYPNLTRRQALLTTLAAATALPNLSFAATSDIDTALRGWVNKNAVPGIVAMAADRKGVIYHGAFGVADMATKRPMREDGIFRIASMTKAVTSVAAMQLMEQGKFALEDPVSKYLPEFSKLQMFASFNSATGDYKLKPVTKAVTVRHLFTHTSGLEYGFLNATVRDFKPRKGEDYPVGPLVFEPGTAWHYGTSVDYLGQLVEKISGQGLEDYFHQHIFVPLGMNDTFYNVPQNKRARLVAENHRVAAGGAIVEDKVQPDPLIAKPIGGGGLASTAADYTRFTRMILNDGALDGARILKPASVALMAQNHIGKLGVPVMKTADPDRSNDFVFTDGGRDKWGLGFLITSVGVPGKRSAGSLSWGGINNTFYWIDRTKGITGVICMQFLPFADPTALAIYDSFERGVYRLA